jgi:hypothetical protein
MEHFETLLCNIVLFQPDARPSLIFVSAGDIPTEQNVPKCLEQIIVARHFPLCRQRPAEPITLAAEKHLLTPFRAPF